ncbi:DOMON domain protein [Teladorsagia circumcincta]|uniref:DOMON domain protein n=1 Tax=Teladorsagia circumcincta TaxID=45464 RepID=A0A2G9V185_TELCI|nr:DOMON domain protein [Teladorsagia circumcincta]
MLAPKIGAAESGLSKFRSYVFQPDGEELEMEIEGEPSSANGYVAVGFSEDPKMGNDMVVFCARFGDTVKGGLARNVKPPRVENNTGVQTVVSATKKGGLIRCVIRQVKKPEDRPELFDLGGSYYILFARGPYVEKDGKKPSEDGDKGKDSGRNIVPFIVFTYKSVSFEEWSTCGTKKGCAFAPEGCEKKNDCIFRFSYKPDGDELEMEIEGTPSSANGYVAVGFSEDQKMGNDMVVFCARFNNAVKGGLARNVKPPRVENNTGVQTIVSATTQGDAIKCVIRQVIKPEDRPELFDLSLSYYILFARGPYVEKGKLFFS